MCYSAAASFAAGAAMIPAGAYCIRTVLRKRRRLLPLALVPLLFGLQQITEGFVWMGLHHGDTALTRCASLVFLFFALAFWPLWFPFMTAAIEPRTRKRSVFIGLTILSVSWFWILFFPLVTGPDDLLKTQIVHHSIRYDFYDLPIYHYISPQVLRIFYFLCVALPMAFGSDGLGRTAGLIFGASAVVSAVVFDYAFVSIWCFFAAWLSGYLCYAFYKMPVR